MINKFVAYLFDDYRKQKNSHLFKNFLYGYILLKCFFWLLNFDVLFGENATTLANVIQMGSFKKFAFLLYFSSSPVFSEVCIGSLILLCGYSLFSRSSYILFDLLIYFLILNINSKIYTSLTAGDPLLANLCFLSTFLRKHFSIINSFWNQVNILLHNVSFIALLTQVCIVYAYSALAKWYDADWLSGNAIHLVNMTHHYSRFFLIDHANLLYPLSFVLSYIVLLYQTLFPVLVWFKKIKKPVLYLGIAMHLYIAFVMGLFFFGLIMVLVYVLFYDYKTTPSK